MEEIKKRKKKRSHEEVLAAREEYRKQQEAKKAAREARKNMTQQERQNLRKQKQNEKFEKVMKKGQIVDSIRVQAYGGEIKPGNTVKAIFAGCPIQGEVTEVRFAEDPESRRRGDSYFIRVSGGPYNNMTCPVLKNKIVEKIG